MISSAISKANVECAAKFVDLALRAGADAADAQVVYSKVKNFSVRLGKIEGTGLSENNLLSLRVFIGRKVSLVSSSSYDADSQQLVERAIDMAKVSLENPSASLVDKSLLAHNYPELDMYDPTIVSDSELYDSAFSAEESALSVSGVRNSLGASSTVAVGGIGLVTSHGFTGSYMKTRFSRSVSVVAGKEGESMERDYDLDSCTFYSSLRNSEEIGLRAGNFAVRRLNPRKMDTGLSTVVFDPRISPHLISSFIQGINGESIARKVSFLRDSLGKKVFSSGITIVDDPFIKRASASRPFDDEGVSFGPLTLVEDGILRNWLLSSSSARDLGFRTNGRGVRSGSSMVSSSTNVSLQPGTISFEALIRSVKKGLYVTEIIGQGTNLITGEYSQGVSGLCIENGELAYPVSGITIASNLKEMFSRITPASDIECHHAISAPTLAVDRIMLASK